jgi:HEAT repeat protein
MVFGLGKPNIENMRVKGDVNGLINALDYKDPQIAWTAMIGLIQIGPSSIGSLAASLQNIDNYNIKSNLANKLTVLALGQLGYEGAIPLLKTCTTDSIPIISKYSTLSLGQFADDTALNPLCNILRDLNEESNIRLAALEMLKRYQDDVALLAILYAAKHRIPGDNIVKDKALETVKNDKTQITQILLHELIGPNKEESAESLAWLGWEPQKDKDGALYYITREEWDKCSEIGAPAVEPLMKTFEDGNENVRMATVKALGNIGDPRTVKPLVNALVDENTDVRRNAAEALDKIGWNPDENEIGILYWLLKGEINKISGMGKPAIEPLINALVDENTDVRRNAAEALSKIGEPAIEPLIKTLEDENIDLRRNTVDILGKMGETAINALIKLLEDEDPGIRMNAAAALNELGWNPYNSEKKAYYWIAMMKMDKVIEIGEAAVEPIIKILKYGDPCLERSQSYQNVSRTLVEALDEIGWKPDKTENGAYYWIAKKEINNAIKSGETAIIPLIKALGDRMSEDVRRNAAEALDEIGWKPDKTENGAYYWIAKGGNGHKSILPEVGETDAQKKSMRMWKKVVSIREPAVEPLIKTLKVLNVDMRANAAAALGMIGDSRGVEPLIKYLNDAYPPVRKHTARALGNIGDTRTVKPLIKILERDEDVLCRSAAACALGQIGDKRAIEPLISHVNYGEVPVVIESAARALDKIGDPRAAQIKRKAERKIEGWYETHRYMDYGESHLKP